MKKQATETRGKWRGAQRPSIPVAVERAADDLRDSGKDWTRLEAEGREWLVARLDYSGDSWEIIIAEVTA